MKSLFSYLLLFLLIVVPLRSRCLDDERSALLHFKNRLVFNSSLSTKLVSWDSSSDCCSWDGVTCSTKAHVVGLDLSYEFTTGPIDESLSKLQSLSVIRLDGNNISGAIPGFFANFSNLTSLSLGNCGLQGTFPQEIFQVPSLQTIDLSSNPELHGSLPEFRNSGSLRSLVLSRTSFSGLLPNSIGNLKMLDTIDISYCSFYGSIPQSIGNLTQLFDLDLSSNNFSGPIDSIHWETLGRTNHLVNVKLDYNSLSGSIPSSIFSAPMFELLSLSHNRFSGRLPDFSNVSSNLFAFDLSFNNLDGPVPVSIFSFQNLKQVSLSSNNFSSFPFNVSPRQPTNFSYLDISHNSLVVNNAGTISSQSSTFLRVDNLLLGSNKLRTFPEFLRNQTYLRKLDLSDNQIQGQVPNWIWRLPSLYYLNLSYNSLISLEGTLINSTSPVSILDLHSNQLRGPIPLFLPGAAYLDYSSNRFSSSIPTNIGDFLTYPVSDFVGSASFLSLSSNNLHGIIPASICNASELLVLDLSNNSLSGRIPQCLAATSRRRVLNLRRNNLTGTISNFQFPENCDLETLELNQNQIEGRFPKSLANCRGLQVLNIDNNRIIDTFPCFLKNISTLRVLALRSNNFYGGIGCSETNGTWPVLQILDFAYNNFNGEVPGLALTTWRTMMTKEDDSLSTVNYREIPHTADEGGPTISYEHAITVTGKGSEMDLVKILTVYTLIDLSSNNFSGTIPEEMGEFKTLYFLNLSSNAFTGEIPSSFGNMRQLESLDLSWNKLSGQIPSQLANLTFLEFLNLSNNQLVGRIPTGTQFSTFPKASFTGNKGLWGPPLTVDNKAGSSPPALNGSKQNSGDEIDWDVISVELGFAFGFGVAVGSLVLCKRWSKWYDKAMYKILVKMFPQLEERIGRHRRHVHINQRWRR